MTVFLILILLEYPILTMIYVTYCNRSATPARGRDGGIDVYAITRQASQPRAADLRANQTRNTAIAVTRTGIGSACAAPSTSSMRPGNRQ